MHESTFKHKFILADPVKIKNDTTQKEYLIQSVNCCFEMVRINKQIIFSDITFYTLTDTDFNILDTQFLEHQLEKRERIHNENKNI